MYVNITQQITAFSIFFLETNDKNSTSRSLSNQHFTRRSESNTIDSQLLTNSFNLTYDYAHLKGVIEPRPKGCITAVFNILHLQFLKTKKNCHKAK